jgi:hypothetical protein
MSENKSNAPGGISPPGSTEAHYSSQNPPGNYGEKPASQSFAPSMQDVGSGSKAEVKADALAEREQATGGEAVETRSQRLAGNLVEQKHTLQKEFFSTVVLVIGSFYIAFLCAIFCLAVKGWLNDLKTPATILIAMLGSIPTILTVFLLTGLFSSKDGKDKDDKSPLSDLSVIGKLLGEILKSLKTPH